MALSGDGNSAVIGGYGDHNGVGAAWVFTRSGSTWTQLGSKLTASDETGGAIFGLAVALSGDGDTAVIGGPFDSHVGAAWMFPIDTVPPATFDLLSPANGAQNLAPRPTLSWAQTTDTGSGVDHYELWIDGAKDQNIPTSACSGGVCSAPAQTSLGQGSHSWLVKVVDVAGNVRASNSTSSFTVDATPPASFSNVAPADGSRLNDPAPTLHWSASSDSGSGLGGYRVMIDGVQSGPDLPATATSYTPSASLADGSHAWQIVAFDQVGNVQPGPTWQVIVDTKPPSAAITTDSSKALMGQTVSFDASTSSDPDGAAIVNYEWDPQGTGTFTSTGTTPTFKYSYLALGTYHAAVRATNDVGLSSTASITITVAPTPPAGNIGVSINNGDYATNTTSVQLYVVWPALATDALISNDGGFGAAAGTTTVALTATIPWLLPSAGSERLPKLVYVRFPDGAYPTQTFIDDIILDTTRPVVQSAGSVGGGAASDIAARTSRTRTRTFRIRLRATEKISGISAAQFSTTRSKGTTVILTNGRRRGILKLARVVRVSMAKRPRYVRVRSAAGNWSKWHRIT